MKVSTCELPGLLLIESKIWKDDRGYFTETYQAREYEQAGIPASFVQDNLSYSHKGVLRGLHAQSGPQAQGKLVRVLRGRAFDVAVDIRVGSPTFGKYTAVELSEDNQQSFWIPPGFLHGFLSLEDHTIFSYKVTGFYDPNAEFGVRWDDEQIQIDWPQIPGLEAYIISEKDQKQPFLKNLDSRFLW